MERRAVVESNHHRKSRDHCQPKHYRKTLDEVLRVETEQGTEPSKYLGIAGKHTVSEMLERVDLRVRIATEKSWMNCTVRALPRWSPTRVLDTPMVA